VSAVDLKTKIPLEISPAPSHKTTGWPKQPVQLLFQISKEPNFAGNFAVASLPERY